MIARWLLLIAITAPPVETPDIDRAQELFALGESTFNLGQYNSTIELWEEAYSLLPPSMRAERAELQVSLADVHRRAHEQNPDPAHLRAASRLYTDYLDAVDADDPARVDIQAELDEVEAELAELESELARAEQAAAAARAAEESVRAAREREAESDRQNYQTLRMDTQRRSQIATENMRTAGGVLVGVGSLSSVLMVVGLALGGAAEFEGKRLASDFPEDVDEAAARRRELTVLLRDGTTYNQIAWTAGLLGGALLISGTALLIHATVQHKRVRLQSSLGGLEVQF